VANSRSARKRIRASERKRVRNRTVRSAVRTKIGRVRHALISGQTAGIDEELRGAVKALDKASEKGIIHRNNAARRKSRIMAMAARLTAMSGSLEEQAATRAAAVGGAKGKTRKASATPAQPRTAPVRASATKANATKASATKRSATKASATKASSTKTSVTKRTTPRP
jgi:small subunit ribosomal protein S20